MFDLTHDVSWDDYLTKERISELEHIFSLIGDDYTPQRENVLRFLKTDLSNIKVIILGQDPYPTKGVATGRSFEPNDLISWNQKFKQVSLKNIIRAIYGAYNGLDYPSISYRECIEDEAFKIKQPKEWFDSLEKQGVLFLNTSLTTVNGSSNVHEKIWASFSLDLIKYLNQNSDLIWFLWGKESQKFIPVINGLIYKSNHPMMCSIKYAEDFLKNPCFKETMNIIDWLG